MPDAPLSVREDVAIAGAAIGLYILLRQRVLRTGIGTIVLSALWFYVSAAIIIPMNGGVGFLSNYAHLGSNYGEIVGNLVLHPVASFRLVFQQDKVLYLFQLATPLAMLSLFAPRALLLAVLPGAVVVLTQSDFQSNLDRQYTWPSLMGWFIAAVEGAVFFASMGERWRRAVGVSLAVASVTGSYVWGVLPGSANWTPDRFIPGQARTEAARTITTRLVPRDASVTADTSLTAFFSQREVLLVTTFGLPEVPKDLQAQVDYIVLDTAPRQYHPNAPLRPTEAALIQIRERGYALAYYDQFLAVLQRDRESTDPAAFQRLIRERRYPCGGLPSLTGSPCEFRAKVTAPGIMTYGPYVRLPEGPYVATFDLTADYLLGGRNAALLRVIATRADKSEYVLAERAVAIDLPETRLAFYNVDPGAVFQFHVIAAGEADLVLRSIDVGPSLGGIVTSVLVRSGNALAPSPGVADLEPDGAALHRRGVHQPGFMVTGPWIRLPPGVYDAEYMLGAEGGGPDEVVAVLDCGSETSTPPWRGPMLEVRRRELPLVGTHAVRMPFTLIAEDAGRANVECRARATGVASIRVERTTITRR